jgi:hypothetical protein
MYKILIIFIFLFTSTVFTYGEEVNSNLQKFTDAEFQLKQLAEQMMNDEDELQRFNACYAFIPKLVEALKIEGSYDFPFDSLQEVVSILYPTDRLFRIITWQVMSESMECRYYGVIQMNKGKELKLFPLYDYSNNIVNPMDTVTNHKAWYGAYYYNMVEKTSKGKKYYTLFGWDGNDYLSNKKVMEILYFDKEGNPLFGAPIIKMNGDTVFHRMILEYKKEATMSLNYNEDLDKIVYDNLIPESPTMLGKYYTYIPDGSYKGFEFKKGSWQYIDKIFTEIFDTPPGPDLK